MIPTDFVQISLLALGGEVQGKTSLQKKVYFFGVLTNTLEELGYRPHFYGPYSDDVAQAVQELRMIGYVEQTVRSAGIADAAGFERCRYDYHLTEAGTRVARAKASVNKDLWTKLDSIAKRLNLAGDIGYMKLSIAAKTYFLLGQSDGQPSKEDLAKLASKFGWSVKPDEIHEAASYLEKLHIFPRSS